VLQFSARFHVSIAYRLTGLKYSRDFELQDPHSVHACTMTLNVHPEGLCLIEAAHGSKLVAEDAHAHGDSFFEFGGDLG